MFDIGFTELLIVAIVGLIVIGPERLPTAAKTVGLWVGRIRRGLGRVQSEISEELRIEEMKQTAKRQQELLDKQTGSIQRSFSDVLKEEVLEGRSSNLMEGAPQDRVEAEADDNSIAPPKPAPDNSGSPAASDKSS